MTADAGSSGGQLVTALGNWGGGQPGTVQFTNVPVPSAGAYRITVYMTNGEAGVKRDVEVQLCGDAAVQHQLLRPGDLLRRPHGAGEPARRTVTITIANPDGPAPSVDRIVLIPV